MEPSLLLITLSFFSLTLAASFTPTPLSTNPIQVPAQPIAGPHYLPTPPPSRALSPAELIAVTSTLSYIESTWRAVYSYQQLESEVFLAAPTEAQLSLAVNGYSWDAIVKQTWYQTGMDTRWRDMVDKQETALQSAMDSVVGGAEKSRGGSNLGVGVMSLFAGLAILGVLLL